GNSSGFVRGGALCPQSPSFRGARTELGLPEFGKFHCPSRQQPTWMRTRNLEIPGLVHPGMTNERSLRAQTYGVATANDACSPASATQAFRRCRPLIAPVTLSTFPTGHDASCTKAIS